MKAGELRKKSSEELNSLMLELHREQFTRRMCMECSRPPSSSSASSGRIKEVRREIARIKTLLTEKGKSEQA